MKKIFGFLIKHKVVVILLIVVASGGVYYFLKNNPSKTNQISYVFSAASKGGVVSSVSGSGQISASNQLVVKSEVSGDVLSVGAVKGAEVKAGDVLVKIDAKEAYRTVRDAQSSLENAKLSLAKAKEAASDTDVKKAENAINQAKDNLEKLKTSQANAYQKALDDKANAETSLANYYDSAFNEISDSFLDFPEVLDGLKAMFYENTIDSYRMNVDWYANQTSFSLADRYRSDLENAYNFARSDYEKALTSYRSQSRSSDDAAVEDLLEESYQTSKSVSEAVKAADNFLRFIYDYLKDDNLSIPSRLTSDQSLVSSYSATVQGRLSGLSTANKNIINGKKSIDNYERTINDLKVSQPIEYKAAEQSLWEKEVALTELKKGPDELDIKTYELSVRQKQDTLSRAYEDLAKYTIKAPFDGVIAKMDLEKGDSVSSGGELLTLITKQQIAEISLNEVDAAKVKVGQKANITFDALSDLTIVGQVIDVDSLGTVSQGVVNYAVKISLSQENDKIKPGMSVSAAIIIEFKQDVVVVPSSAIKSSGDYSYIEVPNGSVGSGELDKSIAWSAGISRNVVTLGLSDDSQTEIVSGLSDGDVYVLRTIDLSSSKTTTSSNNRSLFQAGGNNRSGGAMMIPR
jgi:HlyD family secretion protein